MEETENTDSLSILGVQPEKLQPKPGAPENQIFEYTRKKQKVWVELPGQDLSEPKEKTSFVSETKLDGDATPVARKRGRPRKIRPAELIEPSSTEMNKKVSLDKPYNVTANKVGKGKGLKSSNLKRKDLESPPNNFEPEAISSKLNIASPNHIPIDRLGELKIKPDGTLTGGRQFNIPTFKIPSCPDSYFMLAAPLYRRLGFTDRRQLERGWPDLPIIDLTLSDREYLLENKILKLMLRGFRVCVVPARDAFIFFGHVLIEKGVPIVDDYFENPKQFIRRTIVPRTMDISTPATAQSSEDSDVSLSDLEDLSKNLYFNDKGDNKEDPAFTELTLSMWMAKSAQGFNSRLTKFRKTNNKYYDPHTNLTLRPKPSILQPNTIPTFEDSIVKLLPPDIQEQIKAKKNQCQLEIPPSRFPLALTDKQFQTTIPLHSTRFGFKLNTGDINFLDSIRFTEQPTPNPVSKPEIKNPLNNLNPPQNIKNSPRINLGTLENSRENSTLNSTLNPTQTTPSPIPRFTCGFPRAGTNVPCAFQVSEQGKLCHFHKNTNTESTSSAEDSEASESELNLCIFCNSTSAPSTALDANGGVKLKPNTSQRKKVVRTDTVSCGECQNTYHLWCIQIVDHDVMECMRSYDWVCNDCKRCSVCESPDDEETLLFCDGCDRAQHMACCIPPILELPTGGWKCQICT